jgi:hypothetical protein
MISLILPYWDRQQAANNAFELLAKHYQKTDLEIVVIDDGNVIPFNVPDVPLNINVVTLPTKTGPKCPTTAWNAGVSAASGEIIVLSCIEILHEEPILEQMAAWVKDIGPDAYVLASAYCPEEKKWHCHSSIEVPTCPPGTGIAFCAALYKSLYIRAGGFDDEYRDGAGYEDRDFIWRLVKAGAKFVHRDELTVTHPKSGATTHWQSGGFERNSALYHRKWGDLLKDQRAPLTVVCLKAGKLYGPEYVNILYDMVSRNLPQGYEGSFVCLTDDPEGLSEGIQTIPLPDDLEGWWGKLYMFKRGLFRDKSRLLFMDLDTLIIGNIAEIANYRGQFATLRDFFYPQQLGPAIIAWEAGSFSASIWEEWVAQGEPRHPMGDLWWINNHDQGRFSKKIDKLQDLFPGQIVSYKVDCKPYPPSGANVVCFHGQPKPDNCPDEWVQSVWKIGGMGCSDLSVISNTAREEVHSNVRSACARDLPWLPLLDANDQQAVIVAGGPSVNDTLPGIYWRRGFGQKIVAVNGSARWLNEHGIVPDFHIIIDARPENARFIRESKSKAYYLASQCHTSVFDEALNVKNYHAETPVTVFHMNTEGIESVILKDKEANLISSGSTVGLAAMAVMYCLGYRGLHLHGFDSSYESDHHAYEQPQNDADIATDVMVNGERFKSAPWMVAQVQQFQELATQLANAGTVITVAGRGLLPFVARLMHG